MFVRRGILRPSEENGVACDSSASRQATLYAVLKFG